MYQRGLNSLSLMTIKNNLLWKFHFETSNNDFTREKSERCFLFSKMKLCIGKDAKSRRFKLMPLYLQETVRPDEDYKL